MYAPWKDSTNWEENDPHLRRYRRHAYQRPESPFDQTPGIHTVLGPRRVGKSTLFKLWIKRLLARGIPPEKIAYIDAERFEDWKELLESLYKFNGIYLFIDEATAPKDWPRALKVRVDEGGWEEVCVWITGSNAFDLKMSGERLPGRRGHHLKIRDLELFPLSFIEFHSAWNARGFQNLKDNFEKFLLWGGFPMAVSESFERELPSLDLLTEILDVILGEAGRRHRSPKLTAALAERLWVSLGGRSSYHSLSKYVDAGSHPIIRQYIEILEGSYTLILSERFNAKTKAGVLRKEKKFYFLDPLVAAALGSFAQTGSVSSNWLQDQLKNPSRKGGLVESMIASELRKRQWVFYYDEAMGGEVDFVMPFQKSPHAIEVKLSLPSASEIKPIEAYSHSEVWVYELRKDEEKLSRKTPIFSLVDRLMTLENKFGT